jgi:hypothetical protein
MKKIETSGGLGQGWPTPNSWEEVKGKKKDTFTLNQSRMSITYTITLSITLNCFTSFLTNFVLYFYYRYFLYNLFICVYFTLHF